jgi:hypothetical protein
VRNEEVKEWNILQTIKRRKAKWIGHILRTNCHLKHVTEGKKEGRTTVAGRRERGNKMASKTGEILGIVLGRTRSHSVDDSLWKKLWTCCKTDKSLDKVVLKVLL